jgi:hypothetical protein
MKLSKSLEDSVKKVEAMSNQAMSNQSNEKKSVFGKPQVKQYSGSRFSEPQIVLEDFNLTHK